MSLVGEVIVPADKNISLTVNKRLKKKPGARYCFLRYLEARKLTYCIHGSRAKREISRLGQLSGK
jgi:hypothetical protein